MEQPAGMAPDGPIIALIEWQAPAMQPDDARVMAEQAGALFSRVPGLLEIRFFGDFETGSHFYFQRWESRAALDAYMNSESMFRNREIAQPFAVGRVTRRLLTDYSPPA